MKLSKSDNDNEACTHDEVTSPQPVEEEIMNCGAACTETEHYDSSGPVKSRSPMLLVPDATMISLRNWLAADVVKSCAPYTMITSPFVKRGAKHLSENPFAGFGKYYSLPLIYCDHTASNRPVRSIESYIQKVCLPLYGNTHTNTSVTGAQSTALVAEARQIVAEATNAKITGKASLDCVLFAGSGATACVELLIDCLGFKHRAASPNDRPVIFIGPYEHHSNLIPWRESGCEIVMIPECPVTRNIQYAALERSLQEYAPRNVLKIGTFAAASNVTGLVCDVNHIAALLHRYGALAVFDYATAAPYVSHMDMNPISPHENENIAKDAIFFSPHKMIGGVATPGVLIVKKHLVSQVQVPSRSGGGTVFYVTQEHHRFLSHRVERYEGGTPNVVGIVRVGLTFLLKRQVEAAYQQVVRSAHCPPLIDDSSEIAVPSPPSTIETHDKSTYQEVVHYLRQHAPNLVVLGVDPNAAANEHYPIISFLIRCGPRFLHYNYVCALLNDVFGIQSRGGCQCAGPYSQTLLGLVTPNGEGNVVPNARNRDIEAALVRWKERAELLRPGYTRLSLPFKGLRLEEIDYVLRALVWVASNGWALLCQYRCNHRTGEWRHANRQGKPLGREERKWLSHYSVYHEQNESLPAAVSNESRCFKDILDSTLRSADEILEAAKSDRRSIVEASKMADAALGNDDDAAKLEDLRWFVYPQECASFLLNGGLVPAFESSKLLGALNPNPVYSDAEVLTSADMNSSCDTKLGGECMSVDTTEIEETRSLVTLNLKDVVAANGDAAVDRVVTPIVTAPRSPAPEAKKSARDRTNWGRRSNAPVKKHDNSHVAQSLSAASNKKQRFRHVKPPTKMMRTATQAIIQWDMIQEGDRLLLGLSGGKDSLSLLHVLLEMQRVRPIKFHLEVCTIDPMTPSFDPSPLIPYVESLGLKYHYIRDDIVTRASNAGEEGTMVSSLCAYCARMKRGNLYSCARRNNCNKLVLAQHLDDCAESMMMSIMHNGFLRTMKANYPIDAGDLSVIRPLIYCREGLMTAFAKDANLPVINENCPACFEEPKERARIKKMLSREETLYPNFYDNIRRSLIPLMHDDMQAILHVYTEEAVSRSRKVPYKDRKESPTTALEVPLSEQTSNERTRRFLTEVSDGELYLELARRKAKNQKKAKSSETGVSGDLGIIDGTGQVCTLNGGNGSIPCRELME
jgi:selenocysteine lyase/cysteine desulfurase/tRNA(Ile)-lysidine synthase TilS/MesJ